MIAGGYFTSYRDWGCEGPPKVLSEPDDLGQIPGLYPQYLSGQDS